MNIYDKPYNKKDNVDRNANKKHNVEDKNDYKAMNAMDKDLIQSMIKEEFSQVNRDDTGKSTVDKELMRSMIKDELD